jgi:hypothetical protein
VTNRDPSKNRDMCQALALGGCPFIGRHNNQTKVDFCDRLEVGEKAHWVESVWGYVIPLFGASDGATKLTNK